MPATDAAREAAFDAIKHARPEIIRIISDIHASSGDDYSSARSAELITGSLAQHGYEIETIEGVPGAFRANLLHHDREAMRKGLRHAELALVIDIAASAEERSAEALHLPAGAVLAAAAGIAAALRTEYASISVLGLPTGGTPSARMTLARAGYFEEFDAVIGLRAAAPGEGYCYTIEKSGDSLAAVTATLSFDANGTRDGDSAAQRFIDSTASNGASLEEHERLTITSGATPVASDTEKFLVTVDLAATSRRRIVELLVDLKSAAEAAAGEDGPAVSLDVSNVYDDMIVSRVIARRFKTYGDNLGLAMDKIRQTPPGDPTDWGNISYSSPAYCGPFSTGTDLPLAEVGVNDAAIEQALRAGECLCFLLLDLVRDDSYRAIADAQLIKSLAKRGMTREYRRWLGVHPVLPKSPEQIAEEEAARLKKKGPKVTDIKWVRGPGMPNN